MEFLVYRKELLRRPRTTINAAQSTLFVDVPRTLDETIQIPVQVSSRTLYSSSSQSSINSNTEIDQDRVPCDLCLKTFKKKGLTKHRNSCLKKQ